MGIVNDFVASYGFSGDRLSLRMAKTSRNGLSYHDFSKIVEESPVPEDSWADLLHISDRTLQRYKKDQKSFESIHSERILKLGLLFKFGEEVFGDFQLFKSWLFESSIPLGSQSPYSLLDTTFGMELVRDELGRIQHGIFA
ncbi:type II RES/Xre toxin-antitoxin system antitoxin [Belliella aquatica]|uniref:Toxin-antitoxin system antitoxin component, TIGR02293 family n=1 Tax=Belliella aquatica TaxID=1323734 RepID=A0ABQ1MFV3_9BACT|nr:antitoxin Xre/MbcA/ParS toxin-binding domain-containing protein [Belliella aquatica]MCH7405100.1 DUF2384 domain-containing protein [Belliella aquatica]GGC39759.1 hypothetical protein GCM10010993_18170 [Belliella aquatica]